MPTYDCSCERCGWNGEVVASIATRDEQPCPRCGALEPLTRLLSAPIFKFKGRITPGGGPDRFTADALGIPLKELPAGLRSLPPEKT